MHKSSPVQAKGREKAIAAARKQAARCVALADSGIKTAEDFAKMMSLLIGDIASDRIQTNQANAICNAAGKMLRVVELQYRYGKPKSSSLALIP